MPNEMVDITGSKCVQIEIRSDGKVLWINNEEGCLMRICEIEHLEIIDKR